MGGAFVILVVVEWAPGRCMPCTGSPFSPTFGAATDLPLFGHIACRPAHPRCARSIHTNYQALLNGNLTALSTLRLGDAKSIPAVDVMLRDGFPSLCRALLHGLDVWYSTGARRGKMHPWIHECPVATLE